MEKQHEEPYVNKQHFILVNHPSSSAEEYGWTHEYVKELVETSEADLDMLDDGALNNLGIIYSEGVDVPINMELAIKYFNMAIEEDNDLARSNLADIYRKGTNGIAVDLKKAFEIYSDCHLPYAYYRVGEAYQYGRGVTMDLEKAKYNYRIAYKHGHPLARRKLASFNFFTYK